MLQSGLVKFVPLTFLAEAASQFATIASELIVFQDPLPTYIMSACTSSKDNTD